MRAPQEPVEADAHLDELRRRLYRADATAGDLQAYLEERAAAIPVPAPAAAAPTGRPRRTGLAVLAVGAAILLAAGSALALGLRERPVAEPLRTPMASAEQQDLAVQGALATDGEAPDSTQVAVTIDGSLALGQRFQGYGSTIIAVEAPAGWDSGGRALVAVTTAEPSRVGWRALLYYATGDGTTSPVVMTRGVAEDRSGAHAPTAFTYPSRPPTRIAVDAPAGVGWTLVVAVRTP